MRQAVAAVTVVGVLAFSHAAAFGSQRSDPLNQSSAARWAGRSVTVRLVDDRLISGRVVSAESDALVLQESAGAVRRVRYAEVAAIGESHKGPQILVAIAAVVILISAWICPRLGM